MSGLLQVSGAQSTKPTKFSDIYTGRFFTGIWTNRSPLRDAASPRIEEKFYGARGDAMIAGSNVEISNKLTVIRRPGNPIYDNVNSFNNILSFDQFRIDKALNDAFGSTTESIDLMVDTATALLAENSSFALQAGDTPTSVWTKSTGAGQSFMKQVGNQLYFGNGLDNKKWSQSLFLRNSSNNSTAINTNSYPFIDTFLLDPNHNMQQMIGAWVANISAVSIVSNLLTLTVTSFGGVGTYAMQPIGTQFMLWNFSGANSFLNGATITLTTAYTTGGTTLVGTWTGQHADYSAAGLTGYLQANPNFNFDPTLTPVAGVSGAPITGGSVPVWGTTVPSSSNNFYGSTTLDGNVLWQNRGLSTQNWGLAAPTGKLSVGIAGAAASWQKNTYYSPASIIVDNTNGGTGSGALWQVTTAGTTGSTQPSWGASPTPQAKIEIVNLQVTVANTTVSCKTYTQALSIGDILQVKKMGVSSFLNGVTLTVTAATATTFTATGVFTSNTVGPYDDDGIAVQAVSSPHGPTTKTDGGAVWTCLQSPASLTWAAGTHYYEGDFLTMPIGGNLNLFQLSKRNATVSGQQGQPRVFSNPTGASATNAVNVDLFFTTHTGTSGAFDLTHPSYPSPDATATTTSLFVSNLNYPGSPFEIFYVNVSGAGQLLSTTDTGHSTGWEAVFTTNVYIPFAGNYAFGLIHDDGAFFAFAPTSNDGNGTAALVSGSYTNPFGQVVTAKKGYASPVGNNNSGSFVDSSVWSFSAPGSYEVEIDWTNWQNQGRMILISNGIQIPNCFGATGDISGPMSPSFATTPFTITGAQWDAANSRIIYGSGGSIQETLQSTTVIPGGSGMVTTQGDKLYTWTNLGPLSDYVWVASTPYTLPATNIIDPSGNEQGPIETGVSGSTRPTFNTALNGITNDQAPLKWINEGGVPSTVTAGKITATSTQGWLYAIALVNTQDNTVSNIGPILSSGPGTNGGTGPISNGQVIFAPGDGLPSNLASIDPQADYVAIFRTTDGLSTLLLDPSEGNTNYTVPLTQYIQSGYVDTTPDTGLDAEEQAAAAGENTPPLPGAANLTYHLNRLWYSIGNTVYYTTGPLAPIGNGINGTAPLNFDTMPSLVKRLVATTFGVLVFCVSDIYVIQTQGGNIYPGLPYAPNVGLLSYNALDTNGPEIGFFTTDHQFLLFNPSGALGHQSFPIADQLMLNNGQPGSSWDPSKTYVAHHQFGQDVGWFLADGVNGWYKLITTPAPDGPPNSAGVTWSPFATIASAGAVKAIKAIETSPGQHSLLLGPSGSGVKILYRDVTATADGGTTVNNGTTYPAFAVFGSYVVSQPGSVAQIAFITTDSVNLGSPLILGLLIDEALPYYKGSFEILKDWDSDPPGLPPSTSILGQRFYLSELPDSAAACRHMQVMVQWPSEAAPNELQSFTIFGCFVAEM